ncbi:MAG: hypothetical protein DMG06_29590 [Acidobacteria bacterium]|nr:MAG: hypothetical protein DMG06_29590 [Acidobacteriota bacterium]
MELVRPRGVASGLFAAFHETQRVGHGVQERAEIRIEVGGQQLGSVFDQPEIFTNTFCSPS